MPTYEAPGVYVEEVPLTPTIRGTGTSTAGFIGVSTGGDMPTKPDGTPYVLAAVNEPQLVTNFDQFTRLFGKVDAGNKVLALSLYYFFKNGGSVCYVAHVNDIDVVNDVQAALDQFAKIDEIAIVAAPGARTAGVQTAVVMHCADPNLQDRFAILDGQVTQTITPAAIKGAIDGTAAGSSDYAAIYFPQILVSDPDPAATAPYPLPPSGFMAGIYARVDDKVGVHKAPANARCSVRSGSSIR